MHYPQFFCLVAVKRKMILLLRTQLIHFLKLGRLPTVFFEEIKAEHYIPAFERGMEEQIAEIDAIVNNPRLRHLKIRY